jgi:hypothetical protein
MIGYDMAWVMCMLEPFVSIKDRSSSGSIEQV